MNIDALNKNSFRFRAWPLNGRNAGGCIGGRQGVLTRIRLGLPPINWRCFWKNVAAETTRLALHLLDFQGNKSSLNHRDD
jgi:hypothetical protein